MDPYTYLGGGLLCLPSWFFNATLVIDTASHAADLIWNGIIDQAKLHKVNEVRFLKSEPFI